MRFIELPSSFNVLKIVLEQIIKLIIYFFICIILIYSFKEIYIYKKYFIKKNKTELRLLRTNFSNNNFKF